MIISKVGLFLVKLGALGRKLAPLFLIMPNFEIGEIINYQYQNNC